MRKSDGHLLHIEVVQGARIALLGFDGTSAASQRNDNQPKETLTAKTQDLPGSSAAGTVLKVPPDSIVIAEAEIKAAHLPALQGKADTD